jgi:prepilin-type N-terminal cleavage/methylation domain-containing protein
MKRKAFTLVELLVVIGIIALLISMLLPALSRSRQHAASTVCKSNMHQIAIEMQIYANNYKGWMFPVGNLMPSTHVQYANQYETLGTNKSPNNRWPMRFGFKFTHPDATQAPYNSWPEDIPSGTYDPQYDAAPWTPKIIQCPSDLDAMEAHSYILNKHLARSPDQLVKASSRVKDRGPDKVIIMGEKVSSERDYYMEVGYEADGVTPKSSEFAQKVELFRHGRRLGSNYLFKDWSVYWVPPEEAINAIDPWGLPDTRETGQP